MQLGYTFLNVWLLWSNTYSTFKTLDRRKVGGQGTRSSKLVQKSKREMKTCLSTWVAWFAWIILERVVDATVGIFIPFLHEIKCLCLIFLIITRPWGTEPLVLNVLRPAIKPYLGILDATFHWLELLADLVWMVLTMPYHMFTDWWYSKKEGSDVEDELHALDAPELLIGRFDFSMDDVPEPREEPEPEPEKAEQRLEPSATALAAIEAHRKEQEQQAEEEAKLQEVQARSARDRAAHLQRVAEGPPPAATPPPMVKLTPSPIPNNAATSRASPAASQKQERQENPPEDLPAATLRLPRGVIPVKQMNEPNRINVPVPRNANATLKPKLPVVTKKPSLTTDSSSTDENTKRGVLAMPVPTRPRPQRAVKPAVYSNASATITRPSAPGPPAQVPIVAVPLTSQTLPRQVRVQPIPLAEPQSQSLRTRSSQTLRTDSSTSTVRSGTTTAIVTPNLSEFGSYGSVVTIRRGSADNYVSASRHRREVADGSGTTLDGDSVNNNPGGSGQPVRWEDFMASLERQGQTLAAPIPRGTGDDLQAADGRIPNERRRDVLPTAASKTTRGRGTEEMVQRITSMQKEVDEKIKRITAKSHNVELIASEAQSIYPDLNALLATTQGRTARDAGPTQESDGDTDIVMADTETLVSSIGQSPQSPQSPQQYAGTKRPRKGTKPPINAAASEGDSSNSAEDAGERSPKKRKKDLDEDVEVNAADVSTIASTVKSKPVTRATRQQLKAKDETTTASAPPTVTRSGTMRTTRSTSQKPAEAVGQTASGVGTRTRARRAVVS